jgi:hypothetical protein
MHLELMRDEAKAFPDVDGKDLSSLRVWHCKYASLASLREFSYLRGLDIATFPDASLDPLSALTELRYLSILHLPRVADLGPLRGLVSLRMLRLRTLPSWDSSRKRTFVESLEPLGFLDALRHVELLGVVPADASLAPLERLADLKTANFHGYPRAEVDRFMAASGVSRGHVPEPDF